MLVFVIVYYILQALMKHSRDHFTVLLQIYDFMISEKSILQRIILFVPKISEAYLSEVYNVKALIQAFPSLQQL